MRPDAGRVMLDAPRKGGGSSAGFRIPPCENLPDGVRIVALFDPMKAILWEKFNIEKALILICIESDTYI